MLRECMGWLYGKDISAWCMCTDTYLDTKPIREQYHKRVLSAKYLQNNLSEQWMDDVPITNAWLYDMSTCIRRESPYMFSMTIQETADDLLYIQGFPYYQNSCRDIYSVALIPTSIRTTKKLWEYRPTRTKRRPHITGSYNVDRLFYTSMFGGTGKIYKKSNLYVPFMAADVAGMLDEPLNDHSY